MAAPRKTDESDVTGTDVVSSDSNGFKRLLEAQKQIGNIAKNQKNDHFRSGYADLAQVLSIVTPALQEQDLLLVQRVTRTFGYPHPESSTFAPTGNASVDYNLTTEVVDTRNPDEVFLVSMEYPLVSKDSNDPQKLGGALTYARRYSILTLMGAAAEDDDGNKAATPSPKKAAASAPDKKQLTEKVTELWGITGPAELASVTQEVLGKEINSFKDITVSELSALIAAKTNQVPF